MHEFSPYKQRPIRFLRLDEYADWRIKVYGISANEVGPSAVLVRAALAKAHELLPLPAHGSDTYGAAILIVHAAREANFLLLDWWTGENMLSQEVLTSPHAEPARFTPLADKRISACVWELVVLGHEREAWVETVLANPDGPNLPAYFERRLETRV